MLRLEVCWSERWDIVGVAFTSTSVTAPPVISRFASSTHDCIAPPVGHVNSVAMTTARVTDTATVFWGFGLEFGLVLAMVGLEFVVGGVVGSSFTFN